MTDSQASEFFVQDLQAALRNLYDPPALRKSRLLQWLDLDKRANPAGALRETLAAAIHALKPPAATPPDASAWRVYWILTYRYVEQSPQVTVAGNLGLSDRQLRRQERVAEQALADYLWDRYKLETRAPVVLPAQVITGGDAAEPLSNVPSRQQELQWLRESLPMQTADVCSVITNALKLIAPLVEASGVQVDCALPEDLPPLVARLAIVREAVLNVLTAAVRTAGRERVAVSARASEREIEVQVNAEGENGPTRPVSEAAEALEMAREFAGLCGGRLTVEHQMGQAASFSAVLALPVTQQIEVLVVDDNLDTLRLMQRYLEGTRYRFVGAHDPEGALALAEAQPPKVIVLDVMMPGIDDWELLGRLRALPATAAAPIIVSTILPQEQLALALGASAFIRKPVSRQTLLAALDRLLDPLERGFRSRPERT
jgi:CheY-like chemotaxis protein